jgi:small subunit ribosomal protein S1
MPKHHTPAQYKETFRPDTDAKLDMEIDAALDGISLDALYDQPAKAAPDTTSIPDDSGAKPTRRGRILRVEKEDIFVDFGGKSLGVISHLQFLDKEEPKIGQEMEFIVDRYDPAEGLILLSLPGVAAKNVSWDNLDVGQVVEGNITGSNKGGLEMEVKGIRGFVPAGQVDLYHVPELADYVGQRITAEVTQIDRSSRNLILSRRNILERQKEEAKKQLMKEIAEGQTRRGTVRNVMDFGAFVDLGGMDGLLHVSEMTWRRGRQNAAEFVKIGDMLDVKILKIDPETGKISLSLKQAIGIDPWSDAAVKYTTGMTVTGRVTKVESFGAFIEVEDGIEGLLPVSEMSYQRIRHPSDLVKEGDTLKLVVLSVDQNARRIGFSLKQAGPDPWSTVTERYSSEMVLPGTVTRLTDFGAFIELEPGLEGLAHISELSSRHVNRPDEVVQPGQTVRARILDIDRESRRIALSLKDVPSADAPPLDTAPKKKRTIELRGGLDFQLSKNK